jgi:leader peptidase (prepilin peptidase)/N-methyltransferase
LLDIWCNLLGAAFLLPLGMAVGSFLELARERLPRGESILWPPSHCRVCSRRLTADELIPVISYLAQHGRCRSCDSPIGSGIPIREGLSGLALALPWGGFGCAHPLLSLAGGAVILAGGWTIWGFLGSRKP